MANIPNIFVISGDRHEFAAIEYLGGKVVEFSTSPLSMCVFAYPLYFRLRKLMSWILGSTFPSYAP